MATQDIVKAAQALVDHIAEWGNASAVICGHVDDIRRALAAEPVEDVERSPTDRFAVALMAETDALLAEGHAAGRAEMAGEVRELRKALDGLAVSWETSAASLQGEVDRGECLRQSPESKRSRVQVLLSNAKSMAALLAKLPSDGGGS